MEFRDRLAEAMRISGKTRIQLASEIGVTPVALSHWLRGKVTGMRAQTAARFEAATGVRSTWLMSGEGPKLVGEDQSADRAPLGKRSVPCISYEQAESWLDQEDAKESAEPDRWLISDRGLSQLAFALEVNDTSMSPLIETGDCVIVDPAEKPVPGNLVAGHVQGQGVVLRRYRPLKIAGGEIQAFELSPCNENYPPVRSDETPVKILGAVVEHRRYYP